jgi:hypothetical protein
MLKLIEKVTKFKLEGLIYNIIIIRFNYFISLYLYLVNKEKKITYIT